MTGRSITILFGVSLTSFYISLFLFSPFVVVSERFTSLALSLQNGTHPSPPEDPIVSALDEMQVEAQDVVRGFVTRLNVIMGKGREIFGTVPSPTPETANEPAGGNGHEEQKQNTEVTEEAPEEEEKWVSILPIPTDTSAPVDEAVDPAQVFIGKSKEQILEALGKAEQGEHLHEEL